MFAHDTAYKVRQVRNSVRLGYTVSEGLDMAFGPFAYQQQGAQWEAVNLHLAAALALPDDDGTAGRVLLECETAYANARRAAAV